MYVDWWHKSEIARFIMEKYFRNIYISNFFSNIMEK